MELRDAYLTRALNRLRASPTQSRREQALLARMSERKFRAQRRRRASALGDLASCSDGHDLFQFATRQFPGGLFFPPGPAQRENEILAMLGFATARQPKTVVEIGTSTGGTTFLLGALLPTVTLLVGIDILVRNRQRLRAFARPGLETAFINGSSRAQATIEAVSAVLGDRPVDLLFIDGDHTFFGASQDFRAYRRLVAPGGLIAFHDIVPDSTLRSGSDALTWSGEVPVLWEILRTQFPSHEFVDSPDQEAFGIGVLEHQPAVEPRFVPARQAEIAR